MPDDDQTTTTPPSNHTPENVSDTTTPDDTTPETIPGNQPVSDQLSVTLYKYYKKDNISRAWKNLQIQTTLDATLGAFRASIIIADHLDKKYSVQPFCTTGGAEIDSNSKLQYYLDTTGQKSEGAINIYIKSKSGSASKGELPDNVKNTISRDHNLDELDKGVDLPENTLDRQKSEFVPKDWRASGGKVAAINPADMSEKHWATVMRNNGILCGWHAEEEVPKEFMLGNGKTVTVPGANDVAPARKADYPTFALKPRNTASFDISFDGKYTERTPDNGAIKFRIPRFQIADKTNIEVFETETALQKRKAESGFTQYSVQGSIGGKIKAVSGGAGEGYGYSEDNVSGIGEASDTRYMHVSYNYPRVKLFLDGDQLELSTECQADIDQLRKTPTKELLRSFHKKYGQLFEPEFHLGGRLFATEQFDGVAGSTVTQKITNLKIAASVSLAGWGAQVNVDGKYSNHKNEKDETNRSSMAQPISWCADGGDTTLCNNPTEWCSTVASFYNWRVIQKSKVVSLLDHIGRLPGYGDIPTLARYIEIGDTGIENCVRCSGFNFMNLSDENAPPEKRRSLYHKKGNHDKYGTLDFEIPFPDPRDLFWEDNSEREAKIRFKFGVRYPIVATASDPERSDTRPKWIRHGVMLDPESGRIYFSETAISNVLVEFDDPEDPNCHTKLVPHLHNVVLKFYYPVTNQYYTLYFDPCTTDGHLVYARPLRPGSHSAPTFIFHYHPYATEIFKELHEEMKAIADIKKTAEDAIQARNDARELELLHQRQQQGADAGHQKRVLELRQKCFPDWDAERALRLRLASMYHGAEAAKIKSDTEALENSMIAGVEIFLSYGAELISHEVAFDLLYERKVPQEIIVQLNEHYKELNLRNLFKAVKGRKWWGDGAAL